MKNNNWKLFSEEFPTNINGEYVYILFGHPYWATYFRGMYKHLPDIRLKERISEYDSVNDKMIQWEHEDPTHWMLSPENPQ
jgi:hypothetical protein